MNLIKPQTLIVPDLSEYKGSKLDFEGIFNFELYRNKKLIEKFNFSNGITKVGKNYILNAGFNSGSIIAQGSWVISLIDGATTPTLSAEDTMGSHGGWSEFTDYSESTRQAWGPSTATAQLVTNASLVVFNISADGTVAGIMICSNNTKAGTSGTLWSTGLFPSALPVVGSVDDIKVTYNLAC